MYPRDEFKNDSEGADKVAVEVAKDEAEDAKKEPASPAGDKGGGKAKAKATQKGQAKTKAKERSPLDDLFAKARVLKNKFQASTSASHSLCQMIESNSKQWTWASNPENGGQLRQALTEVHEGMSDFGKQFVVKSAADLRNPYSSEHLTAHLQGFLALSPKIDALEAIHSRLIRTQKPSGA